MTRNGYIGLINGHIYKVCVEFKACHSVPYAHASSSSWHMSMCVRSGFNPFVCKGWVKTTITQLDRYLCCHFETTVIIGLYSAYALIAYAENCWWLMLKMAKPHSAQQSEQVWQKFNMRLETGTTEEYHWRWINIKSMCTAVLREIEISMVNSLFFESGFSVKKLRVFFDATEKRYLHYSLSWT